MQNRTLHRSRLHGIPGLRLRYQTAGDRLLRQSVRRQRTDRPDGRGRRRRHGQLRGQRHEKQGAGHPARSDSRRYGQRLRGCAGHVAPAARSGAADRLRRGGPRGLRMRQRTLFRQYLRLRHLHDHLAAHARPAQAQDRQTGLSDRGRQGACARCTPCRSKWWPTDRLSISTR